jgi:hypothetical protein
MKNDTICIEVRDWQLQNAEGVGVLDATGLSKFTHHAMKNDTILSDL